MYIQHCIMYQEFVRYVFSDFAHRFTLFKSKSPSFAVNGALLLCVARCAGARAAVRAALRERSMPHIASFVLPSHVARMMPAAPRLHELPQGALPDAEVWRDGRVADT